MEPRPSLFEAVRMRLGGGEVSEMPFHRIRMAIRVVCLYCGKTTHGPP